MLTTVKRTIRIQAGFNLPMYKIENAMRKTILYWLALSAATLIWPQRQELNDGEAHGDPPFLLEDGWRPLLNGRDTSGWKGQSGPHEWFTTKGVKWERLLGPTRLTGI